MQSARDLSRKAFLAAVLFESSLVGVALVLASVTATPTLENLRPDAVDAGIGVLLTLPPLAFLAWFVRTEWAPLRHIRDALDSAFVPLFRHCTWDEIVAMALVAGVGEEVLFRGWVQGWVQATMGPWVALVLASALFGAMHAVTRAYAVLATVIGLYLGAAYLTTGNLLTPIVVHTLYDAAALFLLLRRPRPNDLRNGRVPNVEQDEDRPHGGA